MYVNLRWPADSTDPNNHYVPWYVIGWRVLWCPLVYGGKALMFLGTWGATLSLDQALAEWHDC